MHLILWLDVRRGSIIGPHRVILYGLQYFSIWLGIQAVVERLYRYQYSWIYPYKIQIVLWRFPREVYSLQPGWVSDRLIYYLEVRFYNSVEYGALFHELAQHATLILPTENKYIWCFIRGLRRPFCMAI